VFDCRIVDTSTSAGRLGRDKQDDPAGPGDWPRLLAGANDDIVVARDQQVALVDSAGALRWPAPLRCAGRPNRAFLSENRLLVTTFSLEYHAWGNLGPALLIDVSTGALITELRGAEGAALSAGRFVLGLEGYDTFDSWLYAADGEPLQQWRSFGHYIVDPDETIRVLELDRRDPTSSRIVRLHPDGEIERGPQLADGQISPPLVLEDGTALFVDRGRLHAVDRQLRAEVLIELLEIAQDDPWRFTAHLSMADALLHVSISERTARSPIVYTIRRWALELTKHD